MILEWEKIGGNTWRAVDDEAGVVLYNHGHAVTAVPIRETTIEASQ